MQYIKLVTSDEETRWINLAQVSRVTLATDAVSGKPVLAIMFAGASHESKLTITGTTEQNRKMIQSFVAELDRVSEAT